MSCDVFAASVNVDCGDGLGLMGRERTVGGKHPYTYHPLLSLSPPHGTPSPLHSFIQIGNGGG
jgi:hypothetical protein